MLVDIIGYAGDCTITGQVELEGDRVSDMLNRQPTLLVRDARLSGFLGQRPVTVSRLTLDRDDIFAVQVGPPPGERGRRIRKVQHHLRVQLGPYSVIGQLHSLPGTPPLVQLAARRQIIPFTDATIAYLRRETLEVREATALLLNGALIDWIGESDRGQEDALFDALAAMDAPHPGVTGRARDGAAGMTAAGMAAAEEA